MRKSYKPLSISIVAVDLETGFLSASGQLGAKINRAEAQVEEWQTFGSDDIVTPINTGDKPIEF